MKKQLQEVIPRSARSVAPQPAPRAPRTLASSPAPQIARPPKPTTKMIATPIDAQLRQRVRELRGQYEISEAFVVETALRAFFADRPLADVAADLRARGGRLRRNR
jgi:hypothetical protein